MGELFGGVEKKHLKPLKGLLLLVGIQTLTVCDFKVIRGRVMM
jgi:hypothetical protein